MISEGILPHEMINKSKEMLRHLEDTVSYSPENNQYTVKLPWNDRKFLLSSNFTLAFGRLNGLKKKNVKDL